MEESLRPEVVLVIDDDEDCRELARLALKRAGFRVLCLADGQKAIEALHGVRADVTCSLFSGPPATIAAEAAPEVGHEEEQVHG